MKYRVLTYFKLGDYMSHPYQKGDIMTPQPNVAAALMEQGKIEPITDEPPVIETAAMETPHRETTLKAKRKAAVKVQ